MHNYVVGATNAYIYYYAHMHVQKSVTFLLFHLSCCLLEVDTCLAEILQAAS